jgi:hypothetical protein
MRSFSTLPGYRFERRYGRYPRREDMVSYLERYAAHYRLSIRTEVELRRVDRADEDGMWRLETSAGPMLTRYAVVATGYDAVPATPSWPGLESFTGEFIHAAEFRAASPYRGRDVLVVGAGNTGLDIAGHLIAAGANVTVSMRTPPSIFPRQWGPVPLQPLAIVGEHQPAKISDAIGFLLQRLVFGDLTPYGIPRAPEGYESKFRRKLVGAAVDDGFVQALKAGRTRVMSPIKRFEGREIVLADGTRITPTRSFALPATDADSSQSSAISVCCGPTACRSDTVARRSTQPRRGSTSEGSGAETAARSGGPPYMRAASPGRPHEIDRAWPSIRRPSGRADRWRSDESSRMVGNPVVHPSRPQWDAHPGRVTVDLRDAPDQAEAIAPAERSSLATEL